MDISKLISDFDSEITKIKSDRYSGSLIILNSVIESLSKFLNSDTQFTNIEFTYIIKDGLNAVRSIHNQFSALNTFLNEIERIINQYNNSIFDCREKLKLFIFAYNEKWKNVNSNIARNAFRNIDFKNKIIFLHSNSSTVSYIFRQMKERNIKAEVIQTESRPKCEGKIQAKHIASLGFNVTYIVDSAVGKYLTKVDLAIVGADAVFPKFFINKIGTGSLAVLCEKNNIPLYVLADSRKFEKEFTLTPERKKPSSEIWLNPMSKNITIENFYFESISNSLVTKFITEEQNTAFQNE